MLEKRRLEYMEHLGLDNYMPRRQLPGAAPSSLLPDELLHEPDVVSVAHVESLVAGQTVEKFVPHSLTDVQTVPHEDVQETSRLTDLLVESDPPVTIAANNHTAKSISIVGKPVSTETTNETSTIRFTLTGWRIADLLVMDSRVSASALPTDRLLQNVVRSMGYTVAQLPMSDLLRWPLFTSGQFKASSVTQEKNEAVAMVQAYIAAQCQKSSTRCLLLMGQNACGFALSPESSHEDFFMAQQGKVHTHEQWQVPVVVTPSLNDMLLEPSKKRITWQALQAFLSLSYDITRTP
jgi:hypothetical protein